MLPSFTDSTRARKKPNKTNGHQREHEKKYLRYFCPYARSKMPVSQVAWYNILFLAGDTRSAITTRSVDINWLTFLSEVTHRPYITTRGPTSVEYYVKCDTFIPFCAARASASRDFLAMSASVSSRLFSFTFAHPAFSNSVARSRSPSWACPKSREILSVEGSECVDVKLISLPTTRARRKSRDSNANGWRTFWRHEIIFSA